MTFINLEDTSTDCDDTFPKIEFFACSMYGFESCYRNIDVGYQLLVQNYKVRNMDLTFLKKIFNFDAFCDTLQQKEYQLGVK